MSSRDFTQTSFRLSAAALAFRSVQVQPAAGNKQKAAFQRTAAVDLIMKATQARTSRHNKVKCTHTCKRAGLKGLLSRCTWGCPAARTARSRAMQPALAHLRWCHLAKRQVGLKARALPHTRPTVRSSMANCSAGLSKAPVHTACCDRSQDEPTQQSNPQGFRV